MPVDYKSLGSTDSVRRRRYEVLSLHAIGTIPAEIAEKLDINVKTVYNDIEKLYDANLENVPFAIFKRMQESALGMKIKELEERANRPETSENGYNALQRSILDNRTALMKLMGMMSDKVEHSGDVSFSLCWMTDEESYNKIQTTPEAEDVS